MTLHPTTLDENSPAEQMRELFAALETLQDTHLIFTLPNADSDGRALFGMVEEFVAAHRHACVHTSLGQLRYLSCIEHVDAVVGNSSSGITEVPSFRKGTINIGDRQRGRIKASSVIDCDVDRESIVAALDGLYSPTFQAELKTVRNPYGEGGAAEKVVKVLQSYKFEAILKKSFYDISS